MPLPPSVELVPQSFRGSSKLAFYTDGTCLNPSQPRARHAAWALVQDVSADEADRLLALSLWKDTGVMPPHFHIRDRGLVAGRQTIPRAELCAALQPARLGKALGSVETFIYTDSAYVVHVFECFHSGKFRVNLPKMSNLDLLLELEKVWFPAIVVEKVKSHQDPKQASSMPQLWSILGNQVVDQACEGALQADLQVVHEMVADAKSHGDQQRTGLRDVYAYLLDLHAATVVRRNGTNLESTPEANTDRPSLSITTPAVQAWIHTHRCGDMDGTGPSGSALLFQASSWGIRFAWRVWTWAHTLEWTAIPEGEVGGVTTLELFCNFVAETKTSAHAGPAFYWWRYLSGLYHGGSAACSRSARYLVAGFLQ